MTGGKWLSLHPGSPGEASTQLGWRTILLLPYGLRAADKAGQAPPLTGSGKMLNHRQLLHSALKIIPEVLRLLMRTPNRFIPYQRAGLCRLPTEAPVVNQVAVQPLSRITLSGTALMTE
ncbi:hypothetical protein SKAU_G00168780 [Synaphobranchus kaupii]|uniref:Uncharacterized protein n=1 Tax=Synaphobranchus kaupii TaxID=118154 RepID=A0A9Q1FJY3_SYNKA|nr:hypothetical protein SKAU_G00168780 [Synaphobranchus kaupii]